MISRRNLIILSFSILIGAYYVSGIYFFDKFKDSGPWGDFVGGTLSLILNFITFIGLLYTIQQQKLSIEISKAELELTRETLRDSKMELERSANALNEQIRLIETQNLNDIFFRLLSIFYDSRNEIKIPDFKIHQGSDAFSLLIDRLKKTYASLLPETSIEFFDAEVYSKFLNENRIYIDKYFSTLKLLFNFCITNRSKNNFYADTIKSSIEETEVALILYHFAHVSDQSFRNEVGRLLVGCRLNQHYLLRRQDVDRFLREYNIERRFDCTIQ